MIHCIVIRLPFHEPVTNTYFNEIRENIKQRNPYSATSRLLLEIRPSSNLEGLLFVTGSKIVGMSGIKPLQCDTQTKIQLKQNIS